MFLVWQRAMDKCNFISPDRRQFGMGLHVAQGRVSAVDTRRKKLLVSYLSYLISQSNALLLRCNLQLLQNMVCAVEASGKSTHMPVLYAPNNDCCACNNYEVIFGKIPSCKLQEFAATLRQVNNVVTHVTCTTPPPPTPLLLYVSVCVYVCVCQQIFAVILHY